MSEHEHEPVDGPDAASAICAHLRRQSDHYAANPRVDARPDDDREAATS